MNTNELMIGNYVFNNELNKIDIITDIETNRVGLKKSKLPYTPVCKIKPVKITENLLTSLGFIKSELTGNYWIDFKTNYLELVQSGGGYYPIYCQVPEFSHEDEQMVNLHSVIYVHELQNLCYWLTRTGLKLSIAEMKEIELSTNLILKIKNLATMIINCLKKML